jgi:hypothetical protein
MAYPRPIVLFPKYWIIINEIRLPSWVTCTALPRWNAEKINHTTELEKPSNALWKESLLALHSYIDPVSRFSCPQSLHSTDLLVRWSLHWNDWVTESIVNAVNTSTDISTEVVIRANIQLIQWD